MTPSEFRSGGANADMRFAVGDARSARSSSPAATKALSLFSWATILKRSCTISRIDFPRPSSLAAIRTMRTSWPRSSVWSKHPDGFGSSARRARNGVPASGLAGAPRNPRRNDGDVYRNCRAHRHAESGARRRSRCAANKLAVAIPCHRVVRKTARCLATAGASTASAR